MTSSIIPGSPQQNLEDRSVRDVVEYDSGQVNDAWCRKILHAILQSLELQYAAQMPHRAITPDTIVFQANGAPVLISDDADATPAPDSQQADDLTALARVVHYAITQELAPAGPLKGRVDGYSAALLATVDACMDPDPAQRPRSIDAVRGMLGIDALPASSLPASAFPPAGAPAPIEHGAQPDASVEVRRAGMGRRWAIAAGCGAIALALVLFVALRDTGTHDHIVPTLAQTGNTAPAGTPAPGGVPSVGTVAVDAQPDQAATSEEATGAPATVTARDQADRTAQHVAGGPAANPASSRVGSTASGASSGGMTRSGGGVDQPDSVTSTANSVAATAPAADARDAARPVTPSGHASYQLQIKPWGNVYVDGVEHGVSPPLKRLALTPGRHTVRITNPKYRDSILEFDSAQTTSNGKIIVDFNHEAQ